MGLTDLFSKLIVEHGSAEVQAKHIALFKDQLALADKKITKLETENTSLKSQLENSEMTVQKLTKENEELRNKIQEYEQPTEEPTHNNLLEEIRQRILCWLAKHAMTSEQIAGTLQVGPEVAKFHLQELKKMKMVSDSYKRDRHSFIVVWSVAQEGRRFLVENNLIT